ncbi:hypothetical protein TNCV_4141651 [Trichonephila clavipes]|nr:hypothetical protein TNCV_4141651 [Trichonephila clavipes]
MPNSVNVKLGNATRSVPPSRIEMYLGFEVERHGLRGIFLIGGLESARGCGYDGCFGDIRYDENVSERTRYWSAIGRKESVS